MLEFIVQFTDKAAAEKFDRYHGTNGEIVRCRDCKDYIDNVKHIDMACEYSGGPDFYCAAGERRDDDETGND